MKRAWLLALLALPGSAMAQRSSNVTGANLLMFCTDRNFSRVQNCEAYLNGMADAFTGFMKFGPRNPQGKPLAAVACIPQRVTGRDLRLSVIKGLQQNPSLQSRQAADAVSVIYHTDFPCH